MTGVVGRVVVAAPVASALMLLGGGALLTTTALPDEGVVDGLLPNLMLGLALPLLGGAVLRRAPRHPLGRLWVAAGLAASLTVLVRAAAQALHEARPGSTLTLSVGWLSGWVWVLGATPLLTVGLLLFPDGRLPSRRWRPVLGLAAGALVLPALGLALAPGPLEAVPADNPLGVAALGDASAVAGTLGFVCFVLATAAGAASLVLRWRHGDRATRHRLQLPAVTAALLGATFLVPAPDGLTGWHDALVLAEVALLLATFAVAVLRDELAGGGLVVRRSLTYGLLTATVASSYAAAVAVASALVQDRSADLVASVAVALLVLPLRDRVQTLVRRALYGERLDPFAALGRLQEQLEGAADPHGTLDDVAHAVATVLRLPAVRLVTVGEHGETLAAAGGPRGGDPAVPGPWHRVPLRHGDLEVGALLAAPRPGQRDLDAVDLRMLDALRPHAAAALETVRLSAELQASRQRIVAAREEERRRLRRDLHDGLGPTLAGIGLGLELARASDDPAAVDTLLAELTQEAANAVLDVRQLVEDLRPPALDELGLAGALQQHAARLSHRDGCQVDVDAAPLDPLPAAVEVAAYRIAMEAMTNAVRHAAPRHCRLTLERGSDLVVRVVDDGTGRAGTPGVGLGAMRERATELGGTLHVERVPGSGTTVVAVLPLAGA